MTDGVPLTIVLSGYIVGYPLGGMTWHHLNYLLGLKALGHRVVYLEDNAHTPPFNPTTGDAHDPAFGLQYLRDTFDAHDLGDVPWHYRYGTISQGLAASEIDDLLSGADLHLCVSGVTPIDYRPRARRTAVIDTDPVFTQLRMIGDADFAAYYRSFDRVFSFGTLLGTDYCDLPTHDLTWLPTRQPIHLPSWPARPLPADGLLTTLGKWQHAADRGFDFRGRHYASSKATEYAAILDLPARVGTTIELAMAGLDHDERAAWQSAGWQWRDPAVTSATTQSFADYIATSAGELSVAKQIYAGLPSGWFSDRSAAFLATGRPVILQDTGYARGPHALPTGEGLLSFTDLATAEAATRSVLAHPARHAAAARRIAETHFDSRLVLADLLTRVL